MHSRAVLTSNELFKYKVRQIIDCVNSRLTNEQEINVKLSGGWLHRFKERKKFRRYHCHVEAANTNYSIIGQDFPSCIDIH